MVALRQSSVLSVLLRKQHLTTDSAASEPLEVIDDLLGLHATDKLSPFLQLRARMKSFAPSSLEALLDAGRVARVGCMRGTLFIESAELIPLVTAATRGLNGRDRFLLANGLPPRRYAAVAARIESALEGRTLTARELRAAAGVEEPLTPALVVMCDELRLVRWRGPRGWRGGPPAYRRFAEALPGVRPEEWDERAAVRELVLRYVRRYGPVTDDDVAWWTGLRKRVVREALASTSQVVRVGIAGADGAFLAHEHDIAEIERARAARSDQVSLLPLLDPYLQGFRRRERFIDDRDRKFVVDPAGNVTSVILAAGRVLGVWSIAAGPAPELRLFFFRRPTAAMRRRVRAAAAQLARSELGEDAPVVEVDRMTPLDERRAGGVLAPLSERS